MTLKDGLIAYYKFDETSGTTITDATGNYNGSVGGAMINQSGAATNTNRSYYFNNLTIYNKATLPSNTVFDFGTNNFTISFWIKGNWRSTYGTAIIGSTAPYSANSTSIKWDWSGAGYGEKLVFSHYTGSTKPNLVSNTLSENTWYFFTLSRNGDTLSMYKNGSLENSSTGWSAINCNFTMGTYQPTLGWWAADTNDYIQVYLDELGFWRGKALSLAEHQSLYNSGAGLPFEAFGGNLGEYLGSGSSITKGLYHLNRNSTDSSGNGNNGTDTNITYVDGKLGQCASFNGSSSKITLGGAAQTNLNLTSNQTYSMRVKLSGQPGTGLQYRFYDNSGGSSPYGIYCGYLDTLGTKSVIFVYGESISTVGEYTLTNGVRYNIIYIHDDSNNEDLIYIDGNLLKKETGRTSNPSSKTTDKYIGCEKGNGKYTNGLIDEVIIENVARTAEQVKKYYTYAKGQFGIL